ncbi:MAG: hypothetical protein HOE48_14760, partial [Candidatus Latescibacteria bacterium]|nr:hypothetical protein [Candidatus Latescibacterota bacterium]
ATVLGDSTLAIGTRLGGVAILDTQGRLRHVLNKAAGLQDDRVFKLYPDREGGLWIAYENGLSRVETPSRFSLFNETLGAGGLVRKLIRHQGKLYVADHRGLFVLSPPDTPSGFPTFQLGPDIPRNYWFVRSVDQTLLGATGDGIVVIEDGREPKVIHQRASLRIYPSRYYSNLAFAGSIDSLAVLQKNEGEWAFVGHFENVYGSVRNIEEEEPGVFWVSTRVSGNYRITMSHLQNIKSGKVPKMGREDLTGQVDRYEEKHGADNGTLVLSIGDQIAFRHPNGLRRFDVMDGPETLKHLREKYGKNAPVIAAVTASVFEHQRQEYLDVGFDEFINKPLRVEHIYACLVAHLGVVFDYVEEVVDVSEEDVVDWAGVTLLPELYVGLMTAAEEHSITQVQTHIDALEKLGSQEKSLAKHLRELDERYDMEGIKAVLKDIKPT